MLKDMEGGKSQTCQMVRQVESVRIRSGGEEEEVRRKERRVKGQRLQVIKIRKEKDRRIQTEQR